MNFSRVCGLPLVVVASVAAAQVSGATPSGPVPALAAMPSASAQVQPVFLPLRQALDGLGVDRWKLPKPLKESTEANVGSIRRDIETTLPGLLSAADAAPTSVAAMLPVSRNLSALYDVVLRVDVVADAAAPPDQAQAIASAMAALDNVRRGYADRLQAAADAQERHVAEMQRTLAAPAPPTPPAPVCPATAPAAGKKKPAARPAAPPPPR